jgi:hypothetical protein
MRNDSRVFLPALLLFCLLGGSPAAAATEDGAASLTERFFAGSFTGSLLFGYPYTGAGTADMAAVAVLALLALRLVHAGRSRGNDEGRFSVDARSGSCEPSARRRDGVGRNDAGSGDRDCGDGRGSRDDGLPRRTGGGPAEADGTCGPDVPEDGGRDSRRRATARDRAEAMWGYLGSDRQQPADAPAEAAVAPGVTLPEDFDAADFLQGARTLYIRLQKAWASRDIADLSPFVSPEMLETLRKQAESNPEPVKTDIIMINAELKDMQSNGDTQTAQTAFRVLMRTGAASEPVEVAELWTFTRGPESQGMWRLCAIRGM